MDVYVCFQDCITNVILHKSKSSLKEVQMESTTMMMMMLDMIVVTCIPLRSLDWTSVTPSRLVTDSLCGKRPRGLVLLYNIEYFQQSQNQHKHAIFKEGLPVQ